MTDDEAFAEFWRHFPRRVAKGDARKAWIQTAKIRPPLPELLEAIKRACRSEQWQKDGGQFVPYPASWLRSERWDDDYTVNLTPRLPNVTGINQQPAPQRTKEGAELARQALSLIRRAG